MYPTCATKFNKEYEEHAENYFSQALDKINEEKSKDLAVDLKIVTGNPVDRILQESEDGDYDEIIMGSTGLGSIERFLIGSVSSRIKEESKIPVKLFNKEGEEV